MNRQSKRSLLPGCHTVDLNDPDEMVALFPIEIDGVTYLPVDNWEFGEVIGSKGAHLASIFLALPNGFGLHAAMTSVTLRSLAAKMIQFADNIDNKAASQAKDALARAARPGPAV